MAVKIGIGGSLGPLRAGISTRGAGVGLGPFSAGSGRRRTTSSSFRGGLSFPVLARVVTIGIVVGAVWLVLQVCLVMARLVALLVVLLVPTLRRQRAAEVQAAADRDAQETEASVRAEHARWRASYPDEFEYLASDAEALARAADWMDAELKDGNSTPLLFIALTGMRVGRTRVDGIIERASARLGVGRHRLDTWPFRFDGPDYVRLVRYLVDENRRELDTRRNGYEGEPEGTVLTAERVCFADKVGLAWPSSIR